MYIQRIVLAFEALNSTICVKGIQGDPRLLIKRIPLQSILWRAKTSTVVQGQSTNIEKGSPNCFRESMKTLINRIRISRVAVYGP